MCAIFTVTGGCSANLRGGPLFCICVCSKLHNTFQNVNKVLAKSALRAFDLCYLSQEMVVVLVLFDSNVPNKDRQDMADRLVILKPDTLPTVPVNRFGKGYGKPRFPSLDEETTLADLLRISHPPFLCISRAREPCVI